MAVAYPMCVIWPDASSLPSLDMVMQVTRSVWPCRKVWSLLSCTLRITTVAPRG